jgi:hypothetical protein
MIEVPISVCAVVRHGFPRAQDERGWSGVEWAACHWDVWGRRGKSREAPRSADAPRCPLPKNLGPLLPPTICLAVPDGVDDSHGASDFALPFWSKQKTRFWKEHHLILRELPSLEVVRRVSVPKARWQVLVCVLVLGWVCDLLCSALGI